MADQLITVKNRVFADGQAVRIDGHRFLGCRFEKCELLYGGGPFEIDPETVFLKGVEVILDEGAPANVGLFLGRVNAIPGKTGRIERLGGH